MALLSMRARKFYQRTGRKIIIDGSNTAGYDKSKTVKIGDVFLKAMCAIDGAGFDWSDMAEEEIQANMALMAFSDSEVKNDKSCSKNCLKNYEALKKQYDDLLVKLSDTDFKAATYKRGLATLEGQIVKYREHEVLFSEEIALLKRSVGCKEYELGLLRTELEKVKQEKEGFDFKIAKFDKSAKDLNEMLESQITDKSKKGVGYKAVPSPHPLILNRPTTLDLSYSGLEEFKEPEVNKYCPRDSSFKPTTGCDKELDNSMENTDDSLEQHQMTDTETSSFESPLKVDRDWKEKFFYPANHVESVNQIEKQVRKNNDAPIIEDWVSDDEDEVESHVVVEKKTDIPTAAKIEKPVRKSVRYAEMYRSPRPRGNQRNWNGQKSNQLGCNFVFNNKACFICESFDHIQYSCPNQQRKRIVSGNNYNKKDNDYYSKTSHPSAHKHMAPRAVLMKTGLKSFNTARPVNTVRSVNTGRPFSTARSFNTVRPFYTAHPKSTIHYARPRTNFQNQAQSTVHRPFYKRTTLTKRCFNQRFNTSRPFRSTVNTVRARGFNVVKPSACWVWRPIKPNGASLSNSQLNDKGFVDSGCSRHMTGNIAHLLDFKDFDGGYVTFGGGAYGGRITGKGIPQEFLSLVTSSNMIKIIKICIVMPHLEDDSYFESFLMNDSSIKDNGTTVQQVNTARPEINTGSREVSTAVLEVNTAAPEDLVGPSHLFKKKDENLLTMKQGFLSAIYEGKTHQDLHTCLFACFLSQEEPQRVSKALSDPRMIEEEPLVQDGDAADVDEHLYRSMIGSLMYLIASRPDIMFAVCTCARFQVSPKTSHLLAVKRIFRYLKGKPSLGLWYSKDSPLELVAYTDSDYAGATQDRKSTTRGCQFLGNRLISWQCKKQTIVATSTTEADYVAAASCCGQFVKMFSTGITKLELQFKTGKARKRARVVLSEDEEDDSSKQGRINEDPNTYFAQDDEVVHDQDTAAERQLEDSTAGITVSTAPINISTARESPSTAGRVVYGRRSKEARKDKGKEIMTEPEPVKKSKKLLEQERQGLEEAIRLKQQVDEEEKAQIARDEEIARQLLALDEERVTTDPKTTKDIDWNDPSVQKYWNMKNKPKSEAQARKNMIVYLKNQSNYKMKDFDGMSYEEIRPIFEKVWDFNHNFVPMDLGIEKEKKKPAEFQVEQIEKDTTGKRKKSLPRKGTRSTTKRQKVELDDEKEDLKGYLDIVPREEIVVDVDSLSTKYPIVDWKTYTLSENFMYYKIIRGDGSSKNYKILSEMLYDFDRQDIVELYRLVKERYSSSKPEGYDLMLWGDLHTLFEPDEESEIWMNQNEYNLISWSLCELCGVHILLMQNGIAIHMLTKKKYPLGQEMISKMMSKRLEVDQESTQAYELLKFIKS
ncbi:hypothetical protein Tco_1455918 [Tanacetum coccineum]